MNRVGILVGLLLVLLPALARAETQKHENVVPEKPRQGLTYSMDAGYAFRNVYSIPIHAAEIEGSLGYAFHDGVIYGSVSSFVGATEAGLATIHVGFGPSLIFPVSKRVRLGILPRISYFGIRRVTRRDFIDAVTVGIYGSVTLDIANVNSMMLYTGARVGLEKLASAQPETSLWGGTLSVGLRY